ncbi:hypothetical protein RNJ44_00794 [Nakaseomyces bracarensis]|uniref:Uncharacterized protein n=1 Tax=Nakaseomyces bracarensis TaxID=273131 RepID=A0ABR4NS51_9SACH
MEDIERGIKCLREKWEDEIAIKLLEALRVIDLCELRGKLNLDPVVVKCPGDELGRSLCYLVLCYVLVWSPHRVKCEGLTLSNESRGHIDVGILDVIQLHRIKGIETQIIMKDMDLPLGYLVYCALQVENLAWNVNNKVCMDLYICKVMNSDLDNMVGKDQLIEIYNRAMLYPEIVSEKIFDRSYQLLLVENSVNELLPLPSVSLALRVVMEVVDQPDLNFFNQSRLISVLLINLIFLSEHKSMDITELHSVLNELGTTHSLVALFSYLLYHLANFLLRIANICKVLSISDRGMDVMETNAVKTVLKTFRSFEYQLPHWFDKTMHISLPPIPKSTFIFEKAEKMIISSFHTTFERVLLCLFYSINLTTRILNQYKIMGINPFEIDSADEINLKHSKFQLMKYAHQLVFIPAFSTLLLAEQLRSFNTGLLVDTKYLLIFANLIHACTKQYIMSVLSLNENVALYQLLRFISRVSIDDLLLQRISITLLNDILFHSGQPKFRNWCKQKDLCRSAMKSYVHLWNDGSDTYTDIYSKILNSKQPSIEKKKTILAEYLDILPNNMRLEISGTD